MSYQAAINLLDMRRQGADMPEALGLIVKDLEAFKALGYDPKGGALQLVTVPSKPGLDPALEKIKNDDAKAVPMPKAVREQLAKLTHLTVPRSRNAQPVQL